MVVRRKGRWLAAALAAAALLTAVPVADAQEAPPTGENGPVREADPEVVGGSVAAPGEFPWIVALTVRGQPVTSQFCGGSLIAPRRVLTAAHCVVGIVGAGQTTPANQISVLVGTNNLDGSGRRINVIGVHVHPGWNRNQNTFRNDLAALDLAAPANRPLVRGARPAEVGLGNAGRTVTVAGWGRIDPDLQIFPFDLRKGTFPVVSQGVCQSFFPGPTLFRYRHATNLCAGIPGRDACSGDSGGPLVTRTNSGRVQVGIVSFGRIQCGTAPAVYTRVSAYGLSNDAFGRPKVLPQGGGRAISKTFVAGRQPGEPLHAAGNRGGASAWFTWRAPRNRMVTINTGGSNFDTLLGVYRGTAVNRLARIAGNDDARPGVLTSRVTFQARRGTLYRIAVDGFNGAFGNAVVNVG